MKFLDRQPDAGLDRAQGQVQLRGRAMEQDIPVNYLSRLNRLYEEWFRRYNLSPVLKLETDRLDWLTDLVDRADLFRKIEKYLD